MPRDRIERLRGFTLLEVLVVLLLVGLAAGVVVPRLPLVQERLDYALKRETFEQQFATLSYQAFKDNQDFTLLGTYDERGLVAGSRKAPEPGETIDPSLRIRALVGPEREVPPPIVPATIAPPLPDGWRLIVPQPIHFRGSGYCTGGTAELEIGYARYSYVLKAPRCELVRED
jgi:prepilin-type N-terminal cleavage/methylation domain-containing protein